jgi:hypothetical protein
MYMCDKGNDCACVFIGISELFRVWYFYIFLLSISFMCYADHVHVLRSGMEIIGFE